MYIMICELNICHPISSVHKFVNFFNTCNKNNILRMSKYIKETTERRDIIISEQPLVANL